MGHDNGSNYDKRFIGTEDSKDYSTVSNLPKQLNQELAWMMFEDDYEY